MGMGSTVNTHLHGIQNNMNCYVLLNPNKLKPSIKITLCPYLHRDIFCINSITTMGVNYTIRKRIRIAIRSGDV